MWRSAFALCLLLSALPGGDLTDSDPQYMLLVPSLLHGGTEERFCLILSHLNESLSVTVTLELGSENETLLNQQITEPDADLCVLAKIPATEQNQVGSIRLRADGDSLHFRSKRTVLIKNEEHLLFIQTDKALYKPGQKVHIRIAAVDENFHPVSEKLDAVYIENPSGNRVMQWLDLSTHKGIMQQSFQLPSEPPQGLYKVIGTRQKGQRVEHDFTVEEYVLPKFEVQVKMAPVLTILDDVLKVTICGKYTYGKPVSGLIKASVCRKFSQRYSYCQDQEDSVCEEISHQAGRDGCYSEVVQTKIFQMRRTGYEMKIVAKAKIIEDGTDVELTGEGSSEIKNTMATASFRQVDSHYRRGLPLFGQVFLEDAAGNPMSNETVTIFVGYSGENHTYTTGPDGTADFTADTSSWHDSSVYLRATYKTESYCNSQGWVNPSYGEKSQEIKRFYSRSNSFLKIKPIHRTLQCQTVEKIKVHYSLTTSGIGDTKNAVFHYLTMAKGGIVSSGKHTVLLVRNNDAVGYFKFNLNVGMNIAPLAKVLVFLSFDSGEVIADSISLTVDNCFENKAELSFDSTESLPGSNTVLSLVSDPHSLCAVRAVDSSVLLIKPEAELSAKSIYDLLPVKELSGYDYEGYHLEEQREDPCLKADPIFLNGLYYNPSNPEWDTDTYTMLKGLGLKVATNTIIRSPNLCRPPVYHGISLASPGVSMRMHSSMDTMMAPMAMSKYSSGPIETVRKYFPETWLFDLIETDDEGHAKLPLVVPDSITTWKTGMWCMSEKSGIGLSETISHVTFQPMFTDLTLPYSGIRGEDFILQATVFNYLQETIRVGISMENTDEYIAKSRSAKQEGHCIDANDKVTMLWEVKLKSLGEVNFTVSAETLEGEGLCGNEIVRPTQRRKDSVTKHMLVEPEGVEKEVAYNSMICGKGPEISEKISLKLPDQVVEGSARAYFHVIGDVMGTAMQNLGSLLKMPSGCGEQIIALFTPNIYALEYLNKTHQLTPELKSKILSHMTSGYQRQLAYRHYDGAYSAFGPHYGDGNTWLTAFCMKSFARAKKHIYIEEKQITDSLVWLTNRQKENGCFQSSGQLFNNALKGGVDDEITLTAYVTIALLELPLPVTHNAVRNSLFCLESACKGQNSIYTKAIMFYVFTLAGKTDIRNKLLAEMEEHAIKKDNTVHWHRPEFSDDEGIKRGPYRQAPSAEVELNAYMLLGILSAPHVSDEDLTLSTKIVSWMNKQQNSNGGYSSTQDTVVALQALSLYGSLTQTRNEPRTVSLTLDGAPVAELHVEDSNRLLLQHVPLTKVPGDYIATVSGSGCVYLQTSMRYNEPHPTDDAAFSISVTTSPVICNSKSLKTFVIVVNVSYTGKREKTNMAIVDVNLPSGFIPKKSTVKSLTQEPLIKRTEALVNKVIVYFDSLSKDTQTFRFTAEQDYPVDNLQPVTVKVYDYYEKDDFAVTFYSAPCSSKGITNYGNLPNSFT
ncbi:alpha-2-macroglobulin [Pelodytes ibericus]